MKNSNKFNFILVIFFLIFLNNSFLFAQTQSTLQLQQLAYSIEGISANEKQQLTDKLTELFKPVTTTKNLDSEILHNIAGVLSACLFEDASIIVAADIAYKSYLAEQNGAPDIYVQDLAIIGISTNLTADQLEMSAKGIQHFMDAGIDPVVTEYFFSYGLYNSWSGETIEQSSQGLTQGVRQGLNAKRLALSLIIGIDQEIQQKSAARIVSESIDFLETLKQTAPQESQRQDIAYLQMQNAIQKGLSDFVASEIYYNAIKDKWSPELIEAVFGGLNKGINEGLTPEKLATSILVRLAQSGRNYSPKKLIAEEFSYVAGIEKKRSQLILNDEKKFQRKSLPPDYEIRQSSLSGRPTPQKQEPSQYFNATNRNGLDHNLLWQNIQEYLGPPPTPYRWGGTSKFGIDCSGFVMNIMRQQGFWLPRTSKKQFLVGKPVMGNLQIGDLIFFSKYGPAYEVTHVGMYIGGDKFVHSCASKGVTISSLNKSYYRVRYKGARRII